MAAQPVEWVLVIFYGPSAHRATYGRLDGNKYTKDYIQLTNRILKTAAELFPLAASSGDWSAPLTYQWPTGTTPGEFVSKSADRPHLKWETTSGAPKAWKMSLAPSEATAETIPGDPSHTDENAAENEFKLLASRGAGQPYLIAIKLLDELNKLHLRAYLKDPSEEFAWADLKLVPEEVQALAAKTSRARATEWATFQSGGVPPNLKVEDILSQLEAEGDSSAVIDALDADAGRELANYIRQPGHGVFFDPTRNHDAWLQPKPLSEQVAASVDKFLDVLDVRFPPTPDGDAAAETLETDPDEIETFRTQIQQKSFEVPDSTATAKTRGSAQKSFADAVKLNYGNQCAITGIATRDFLIGSHIVPWSKDQTIRLDPSNGICLSLLVDRAFEKGYLLIEDDHTIRIDWDRVGNDNALRSQLEQYDGQKLNAPADGGPKQEYLQRRRTLVVPTE